MDHATALVVLGVGAETPLVDVRRRYLELLRRHHPDVAAADSTIDAATITEAYRVVRAFEPALVDQPAGDGTIAVEAPADEAFLAVLDAAGAVGSVSYVDADAGLLEAIVDVAGSTFSLLISLQGRASGVTEAFCTVERLAGRGAVDTIALINEFAEVVEGFLNSGSSDPT